MSSKGDVYEKALQEYGKSHGITFLSRHYETLERWFENKQFGEEEISQVTKWPVFDNEAKAHQFIVWLKEFITNQSPPALNTVSAPKTVLPALKIMSPFMNNIKKFGKKFGLNCFFAIPGIDDPLNLHEDILKSASTTIASLLDAKQNAYGKCDFEAHRVEWVFESDETYRKVMVKWLRFCYGEEQVFTAEECPAALETFIQLGIQCNVDAKKVIDEYMANVACKDAVRGVMMFEKCVVDYKVHALDKMVIKNLAMTMLRRENVEKYQDIVVNKCLVELPEEYLDMTEFNEEAQNGLCEFNIRLQYIQANETRLGKEGKWRVICKCDKSKLRSTELRRIKALAICEPEKMIEFCIATLESKEEEERKKKMKAEALRKGGYLLDKNSELNTEAEVRETFGDLEALCELLKGNAIPTKILDLSCDGD